MCVTFRNEPPLWSCAGIKHGGACIPSLLQPCFPGGVAARERFWSPLLWTFAAIGLTVLAGLVVFGPQSAYRDVVAPIWTVVSLVPLALVCARGVWLGDRVAPWILVATAPPVLATLWQVAHFMGWVEYGLLGLYGLQLGLVWQFPVMLFALAMRAQERRAVRQRVSDLNRVDGSTGLVLSQVLIYRANLATIRARRNQGQAALLRVDVENAEALRKEFGRKPFADLQLRFAERLLRVMRDIDTVALLDDGQYAVFVDGPVHEHDVRELATKIVARSLKPFTSLNHNLLPKIRITCLMLPWADEDAVRALAALDAAYRKRDPTDRRAIQILTAEEASSANASPQPKKASEEQAGA